MQRLEPLSKTLVIPLRDGKPTEFEIHAGIYGALKGLGFDVRGEIQLKDVATRKLYRFDLVLFLDGAPKEIVEVKAAPIRHRNGLENTRQGKRYRHFGVPVFFVYGEKDAQEYINLKIRERGS